MVVRISAFNFNIINKSEVWTASHCLSLGRDIMVCTLCQWIMKISDDGDSGGDGGGGGCSGGGGGGDDDDDDDGW